MPEISEWTFAADFCKAIQGILADTPELPFSEAKVEEAAKAGRERQDLTVYGTAGKPVKEGRVYINVAQRSPSSVAALPPRLAFGAPIKCIGALEKPQG